VLDPGPVVPAAVEQHDLAGRRQVLDVPLEEPLGLLPLGRRGEGGDARDARVEVLGDALDRAALACGVAALEDHHNPGLLCAYPLLGLHQLGLEPVELGLVQLARQPVRQGLLCGLSPLGVMVLARRGRHRVVFAGHQAAPPMRWAPCSKLRVTSSV
jgi:hypothetical protein